MPIGYVICQPVVCHSVHRAACPHIYISAWASALLVLRWRAMRRPRYAGRQRYRLPRFFVYMLQHSLLKTFPPWGVWRKQQENDMEKEDAQQTCTTKLRLVRYSIKPFGGSIGDFESGGHDANELMQERKGWFHTWGNAPFYDAETSTWHDKTVAIVEEKETGKIHKVQPEFLNFVEE